MFFQIPEGCWFTFGSGGKRLSKGINIYMEMQRTKTTSDGNLLCSLSTTTSLMAETLRLGFWEDTVWSRAHLI